MNGIEDKVIERTVNRLVEIKSEACRELALEGARCAASFWREEDGGPGDFERFCEAQFAATRQERDELFSRLESVFEELFGSALAVSRTFQWGAHIEAGPLLPVDAILSEWSPYAHLSDDFYANKLAFVVHLNFPYKSLELKQKEGHAWSRRQWAEARLGDFYSERVPAAVTQGLASAFSSAENYIAAYYLYPSRLGGVGAPADTNFPEDKRLLMHWNMRDEIKALYAEAGAAPKQRILYKAMERVVDGTIPTDFIDSRELRWDPFSGAVAQNGVELVDPRREGDGRYEKLLEIFRAERGLDQWSPDNPTLIQRKFNTERELPEKDVERLLHEVLSSKALGRVAGTIRKKLGRPLEAFDVWFKGFAESGARDEAALDAITRKRYPDARAFKADIPRILSVLGFDRDTALWLADRIEVDQARGSGHAMPAAKRSDSVRLRTRVPATGMDYKGFNIACHELGHNVEQVFSLHGVDEYFMAGVPNNAFTEAFAFVFQARDLAILGIEGAPGKASVLADYWSSCEIAGVGLVDMELWRWLYEHPDCSAGELREAAMRISRSVWNRYFADAFGFRDALVLGVYSHMIELAMYLPDYPLGHIIAFQIEAAMAGATVGERMGSMCRLGRLTPNEWMRQATGSEVSAGPLVEAVTRELDSLR